MRLRLLASATLLLLIVPAGASAAPSRLALPGTLPTLVTSARQLGPASVAAPVDAIISLRHRDEAVLKARIARVADPSSAAYAHYMTPAQFRARFAPTAATVAAVERFATQAGLAVRSVPSNHAYVRVTGTVAAAERAFATPIAQYAVGGHTVQAPVHALSIPASLRTVVTDVVGLNTADVAHPMASPPPAFVNAGPCSTYYGEKMATDQPQAYGATRPYAPCGYTPQQLQGAYGLKAAIAAGNDGRGQRVAVIDAYSSPLAQQDLDTWSARRGMASTTIDFHDTATERNAVQGPAPAVPTDTPIAGGQGVAVPPVQDPQGWSGEETLDLEAVHAVAPGATLVYQGAESPTNEFLHMAQNAAVNGKIAQIISNSYGGTADETDDTSDGYWMQAAMTGIGIYFSSGDDGDNTAGSTDTTDKAVESPANSPYVTAVGGTSLGVGKDDDYQFETYWGVFNASPSGNAFATPGTFSAGGGGGTSEVYAEPDYQKGVVPDAYASIWKNDPNRLMADPLGDPAAIIPGRVVPDVAMDADSNTGFLMGQVQDFDAHNRANVTAPGDQTKYSEYRIGGTSLSSPLFAGVMALADQAAGLHHGFANPALYKGQQGVAFRDISSPASPVAEVRNDYANMVDGTTTTTLRTTGQLGALHSTPGFDDSTGLGSPLGPGFLKLLAPNFSLPTASTPTTAAVPSPAPAAAATNPSATPAKGCTPPTTLSFALHAEKGQRVTHVTVTVDGKRLTARSGHKLTRVTIRRPKGATFKVVVATRSNRGSTKTSTRRYSASGCAKSKVTVVSHRHR